MPPPKQADRLTWWSVWTECCGRNKLGFHAGGAPLQLRVDSVFGGHDQPNVNRCLPGRGLSRLSVRQPRVLVLHHPDAKLLVILQPRRKTKTLLSVFVNRFGDSGQTGAGPQVLPGEALGGGNALRTIRNLSTMSHEAFVPPV
eukprot:589723-Prorocentrum_minimum.AAC.2